MSPEYRGAEYVGRNGAPVYVEDPDALDDFGLAIMKLVETRCPLAAAGLKRSDCKHSRNCLPPGYLVCVPDNEAIACAEAYAKFTETLPPCPEGLSVTFE